MADEPTEYTLTPEEIKEERTKERITYLYRTIMIVASISLIFTSVFCPPVAYFTGAALLVLQGLRQFDKKSNYKISHFLVRNAKKCLPKKKNASPSSSREAKNSKSENPPASHGKNCHHIHVSLGCKVHKEKHKLFAKGSTFFSKSHHTHHIKTMQPMLNMCHTSYGRR